MPARVRLKRAPLHCTSCNVIGALEPDPGASVSIIDALTIAQAVAGLPATLMCC